jgi:hypothetical protein
VKSDIVALDFISRALGVGETPSETADRCSRIDALPLGWEAVVSLANQQLLTPALWVELQRKGLSGHVPEDFQEYLHNLYELNKTRNERLKAQLTEAVTRWNRSGIEPLLIKGAGHLFDSPFGDPAARVMADLDIVVRENELGTARDLLLSLGYCDRPKEGRDYSQHLHIAPLFREGDFGPIELHREVVPFSDLLPSPSVWEHSQPLEVDDLRMRIQSPTHRVFHNFIHSELAHENYEDGSIALQHLYEMVQLCAKNDVDWTSIKESVDRERAGYILESFVYLAHRLLGFDVPGVFRIPPRSWIHYVRARTEVRWGWVRLVDTHIRNSSAERNRPRGGPFRKTRGRLRYACHLLGRCADEVVGRLRR